MKKTFLFLFINLLLTSSIVSAETELNRPHWSFEIKGGLFVPAVKEWESSYGRRDVARYGASLAYKFLPQLEAGIEGSWIRDKGRGEGFDHGTAAGNLTTDLAPLNVFVLLRGVFSDGQWIVPYAGGGWTRIFYRQEIEHQGTARGDTDGYHARGGIQFLLDVLDPDAATNIFNDYGVFHTYFFLEAQYSRATIDTLSDGSVNLGGKSWMGGLLFEF